MVHVLVLAAILTRSVLRQSFHHNSQAPMNYNTVDWLESSESTEHNYENKIEIPVDDWWESRFGISHISHADATEDRAIPEPITAALVSVPPSSNGGNPSPSSHPSSHPDAEARSSYQAIQSPTEFAPKFDAQSAHYHGEPNNAVSSSMFTDTLSYGPLRGIGNESAGYALNYENATSPHRSFHIRCGFEQQPRTPLYLTAARSYDEDLLDDYFLHNLRNTARSNALPANRAGHVTRDNSAKRCFRYDEDHRYAPHQTFVHTNEYAETPLAHSAGASSVLPHEAQSLARPASGQGNSSSKNSSQASLSTTCSTSANTTLAADDSCKYDNCGRVLTTKGTRNRNRNRRRHRCPGTGPKCFCPICPKSFNRGDTRLLHMRKRHPEFHSEPPRPRKR